MQWSRFFSVVDSIANSSLATGTYLGATLAGASADTRDGLTIAMGQLAQIGASFMLPKAGISPLFGVDGRPSESRAQGNQPDNVGKGPSPGPKKTIESVAYPEGLAYRADLPDHLFGPDGFTKSGQLSGTHNLRNATAALDAQGATYKINPTSTNGISELEYSYTTSAGKVVTGSKTVYDPALYSDQKILDLSQTAGQRAYESYLKSSAQGTRFDLTEGGVNFRVYINFDPVTGAPFIGNVHPIK